MISRLEALRREFRPLGRLAGPLVLAEIGWMTMGVVDTMMVGRLRESAEAIGAVSLGGILFFTVAVGGMGLLLGLDTVVSQAFGAGKVEDCHRYLYKWRLSKSASGRRPDGAPLGLRTFTAVLGNSPRRHTRGDPLS